MPFWRKGVALATLYLPLLDGRSWILYRDWCHDALFSFEADWIMWDVGSEGNGGEAGGEICYAIMPLPDTELAVVTEIKLDLGGWVCITHRAINNRDIMDPRRLPLRTWRSTSSALVNPVVTSFMAIFVRSAVRLLHQSLITKNDINGERVKSFVR
jgi:hypothetical protein